MFIEGNPGVRFLELCLQELHLLLSVVEPSLFVRLATEGHEGGLSRFLMRVRFMFMDYCQGRPQRLVRIGQRGGRVTSLKRATITLYQKQGNDDHYLSSSSLGV